ncbi:hypothetical protein K457DRAFT_142735 [Linnemannia elongata AG-77]|uniref:Uncharacterized protein n=1 Tax=Linnemannia elongata AG-77 TaxID=1314771 RepID=A0A197JE80_9FUNG|nr:hypothetical protein K457DRAFT_142735 [Linnemannia elongata AG-77]
MSYLQRNSQEGVNGPEVLQEWKIDRRAGLVVTRKDEEGNRIVLWRDVENMFANYVPKYAHLGDFIIPFHVHHNLTEKEPKRISYYPGERIDIVARSLSSNGSPYLDYVFESPVLFISLFSLFLFAITRGLK